WSWWGGDRGARALRRIADRDLSRRTRVKGMMASKKEQQHFTSRFYLAGFTDPCDLSSLWIYDKERLSIARSSPKDAGRRRHYYSIPKIDGTRDLSVEDALAVAENQTAPLWERLIGGGPFDNKERSVISFFLALLLIRVPAFRGAIEQLNAAIV